MPQALRRSVADALIPLALKLGHCQTFNAISLKSRPSAMKMGAA
jgi:hypothetical protein